MKTTLDLPAAALRRAKGAADDHGVTLQQFIAEALDEKLRRASGPRASGGDADPPCPGWPDSARWPISGRRTAASKR